MMRLTGVHVGLSLVLLGGCAGQGGNAKVGPDHPANPAAAEAPPAPRSLTLAVDASAVPATEARGVVPSQGQQPGSHAAASGATPATSPAGTRYVCPMHPEVTSANPNDRCPKCGMKISKPIKAAPAPAAVPHAANGPAAHPHDHGGGNK